MATLRSVLHVGLSEVCSQNMLRIPSRGINNHQGRPWGHASIFRHCCMMSYLDMEPLTVLLRYYYFMTLQHSLVLAWPPHLDHCVTVVDNDGA